RFRIDLEGADDAAHAADVGHQRDPRDRAHRGHADRRHRRLDAREGARLRGRRLRHHQHRRRLPGDRSDARDVQAAPAARGRVTVVSRTWIELAYLVPSICLTLGIRGLSHPRTARMGNLIAAVGMAIAVGFTFAIKEIDTYWLMLAGIALGSVIGVASARMVRMTAIPQM